MKISRILNLILLIFISISLSSCSIIFDNIVDEIEENNFLHYWYDEDVLLFYEESNTSSIINKDLPTANEMWNYLSWDYEISFSGENTVINYFLQKSLNKDYFIGNVFQIVTYDLGKIPISTGSGFVINDSGLFITNAHVVDGAYYISAFFDIEDRNNNNSFTELEIEFIRYFDVSKDLAIGKINNYSKIKNHYKEINFTENHENGETTYSIGYPNSSTDLEIHKGKVVDDISSLYSKVIQGLTYIGSTSFIAPGSSGGILINKNGEVLGITTIQVSNNDGFTVGGSISFNNFKNIINMQSTYKNLHELFYPNKLNFVEYFDSLYNDSSTNLEKVDFTSYTRFIRTTKIEGTNNNNLDYSITETTTIDSDGYIEFYSLTYWEDGMKREMKFVGYYNQDNNPFRDFIFQYYYEWSDNDWYRVYSNEINYSSNLSLTLMEYSTSKASGTQISDSNIEYFKARFNEIYDDLFNLFN